MHDGAAPRDAGSGAAHLRGEARVWTDLWLKVKGQISVHGSWSTDGSGL